MSSIYSITSEVISKSKSQKFMDPGVHENVKLVDVKASVSAGGKVFIAFYWENADGQSAVKTEYEVNTTGKVPVEQLDTKALETYLSMVKKQMTRIVYIAKQFVPEEELVNKEFANYEDFTKFIASKLTPEVYKDVDLRLKITFDKDGWLTVPSYVREATNPWIERMDKVSKEASKMAIDASIDITTRNTAKNTKTNPLLDDEDVAVGRNIGTFEKEEPKKSNDDLPF